MSGERQNLGLRRRRPSFSAMLPPELSRRENLSLFARSVWNQDGLESPILYATAKLSTTNAPSLGLERLAAAASTTSEAMV